MFEHPKAEKRARRGKRVRTTGSVLNRTRPRGRTLLTMFKFGTKRLRCEQFEEGADFAQEMYFSYMTKQKRKPDMEMRSIYAVRTPSHLNDLGLRLKNPF